MPRQAWKSWWAGKGGGGGGLRHFFFVVKYFGKFLDTECVGVPIVHHQPLWQAKKQGGQNKNERGVALPPPPRKNVFSDPRGGGWPPPPPCVRACAACSPTFSDYYYFSIAKYKMCISMYFNPLSPTKKIIRASINTDSPGLGTEMTWYTDIMLKTSNRNVCLSVSESTTLAPPLHNEINTSQNPLVTQSI